MGRSTTISLGCCTGAIWATVRAGPSVDAALLDAEGRLFAPPVVPVVVVLGRLVADDDARVTGAFDAAPRAPDVAVVVAVLAFTLDVLGRADAPADDCLARDDGVVVARGVVVAPVRGVVVARGVAVVARGVVVVVGVDGLREPDDGVADDGVAEVLLDGVVIAVVALGLRAALEGVVEGRADAVVADGVLLDVPLGAVACTGVAVAGFVVEAAPCTGDCCVASLSASESLSGSTKMPWLALHVKYVLPLTVPSLSPKGSLRATPHH